jgi:hypothetical protein
VWVIDFFHAGRGHVLKDLAKFENDLLYLLTPVDDNAQLREAISITLALREVADLRAPLADVPDGVRSRHLVRAWEILRVLRSAISQVIHDDRNPLQYQVAGLRYAVHTLGFPEPSRLQKQSALVAACTLADQIATTVEANLVLRIDWVESPLIRSGRLGMTICPDGAIAIATSKRTLADCAPRAWIDCCACRPRPSSIGPGFRIWVAERRRPGSTTAGFPCPTRERAR